MKQPSPYSDMPPVLSPARAAQAAALSAEQAAMAAFPDLPPISDQELQERAEASSKAVDRALKKIGLDGNYEIDSAAIAKVVRRHYGDEAGEVLRRAATKADEL